MNLYFSARRGPAFLDFPYQTQTEISYAVMAATTIEERMEIIRKDLEGRREGWSNELVDEILADILQNMENPDLILEMG